MASPDDDLTEERVRELLRQGLGDELARVVWLCCAPIFWGHPPNGPFSNSATTFFVNTGERTIGITACHVVERFREARGDNPALECQIKGALFPLLDRLIDFSHALDLVTFAASEDEVRRLGTGVHFSSPPWPPAPPEQGKGVFFGGFPGSDRLHEEGRVNWGFGWGLMPVEVVEHNRLVIRFDHERWVQPKDVPLPPPGTSWGGLSGAPLFAVVRTALLTWRLVGVVKEFHQTDYLELLYAIPIEFVRPDGTIRGK
jgi:hypothetical protein